MSSCAGKSRLFSAVPEQGVTNTNDREHVRLVSVPVTLPVSLNAENLNVKGEHHTNQSMRMHEHGSSNSSKRNMNAKPKATNKPRKSKPPHQKKSTSNSTSDSSHSSSIGPSTDWVTVTNIPPLSTIDDLLIDVERIMTTELSMGIVDLDAAENMLKQSIEEEIPQEQPQEQQQPPQLPLWEPNESLPNHLVIEAHIMLSTLGRPSGWYLRFPNRSCVHALLSHIDQARKTQTAFKRMQFETRKENGKLATKAKEMREEPPDLPPVPEFSWKDEDARPLMCAWKECSVEPFDATVQRNMVEPFFGMLKYGISDCAVRVENCARESTVDDVKYFFSRYGLLDERSSGELLKAVEQIVEGASAGPFIQQKRQTTQGGTGTSPSPMHRATKSATSSFVVRFASNADARAAVREKQNVEFMGRRLRLAQYSRQIFNQDQ